jgi:hypothetical protein
MGVGGNDSWSDVAAPLEKYQIHPGNYHYSFIIIPGNTFPSTSVMSGRPSLEALSLKYKGDK